jgi:phosphate butyryltransferase
MIGTFDDLLADAAKVAGSTLVVALPANEQTFDAIREAQKRLKVNVLLVGDRDLINHGLTGRGCDPSRTKIVHQPDTGKAVQAAVELAREGKRTILMKGSIDTATLMRAVLDETSGLRTGRLLSDIFLFEYPARERNTFVMITDGGVTLLPDLKAKVELINNAVEVAHALGNTMPKVAILSASEFVNPNLPSTIDAAVLSKMNERGQIKGCIVDGPLALDNAISADAVHEKGIVSQVAGHAEILVAANIETANSLAKSTTFFAGLRLAHVIIGAKVPILIPSRADRSDAKVLSIALGIVVREFADRRESASVTPERNT